MVLLMNCRCTRVQLLGTDWPAAPHICGADLGLRRFIHTYVCTLGCAEAHWCAAPVMPAPQHIPAGFPPAGTARPTHGGHPPKQLRILLAHPLARLGTADACRSKPSLLFFVRRHGTLLALARAAWTAVRIRTDYHEPGGTWPGCPWTCPPQHRKLNPPIAAMQLPSPAPRAHAPAQPVGRVARARRLQASLQEIEQLPCMAWPLCPLH